MEFTTEINAVSRRRTLFEGASEQPVDCDITLPEYFPDVVRVLKCTLTPRITGVQASTDRITAEGSALLRILYVSDGGVRCFEQSIPFSKAAECTDLDGACVSAQAKTEYVNCRVHSPRKMDIHGSISITFNAYRKESAQMICGCAGGNVQVRKKRVCVSNLAGCTERLFPMGETLELGSAKPSIAQLVKSEAVALLEDVKVVTGKVLVKGELIIRTLYIPDSEDGELQSMEHSMPISQILEAEGAEEDCVTDAGLTVSSLEIAAKTDASGALRLLDANVYVCAQIALYRDCETDAVTDAYSTKYEIAMQKKPMELLRICDRFTDTYLCRGTLDTTGLNITQIADMTCQSLNSTASMREGELRVNGTVQVGFLYTDRDGQWGFAERSFDFAYKRAVAGTGDTLNCDPHLTVTGVHFLLSAEDKIDARVEMDINALIFSAQTVQVATNIAIDESKPKKQKTAALTIYFTQEGESVWEIARRYNTTAEAIIAENALTGDVIQEKRKLLIPRV